MKFTCPHCAQRIETDDSVAGAVVECPSCSLNLTVPENLKPPSTPPTPPLQQPKQKEKLVAPKKNLKRRIGVAALVVVAGLIAFRAFCGVFIIQPIGAIPDGGTLIYWRSGLNMPFIASADELQQEFDGGVSLLGRGVILAGLSETLKERKIVSLPYSKTLYLWSTGGLEYDR